MAEVNPDPHAHGYVFIPTNRVTGVFASYDDLQEALQALEPLGFDRVCPTFYWTCSHESVHIWETQPPHHSCTRNQLKIKA